LFPCIGSSNCCATRYRVRTIAHPQPRVKGYCQQAQAGVHSGRWPSHHAPVPSAAAPSSWTRTARAASCVAARSWPSPPLHRRSTPAHTGGTPAVGWPSGSEC
jgi:hypothetical protein